MSTHPCPHPDCDKSIALSLFACPPHWYELPRSIRWGIESAWRKIKRGDAAGIDAHDAATDEAIAYWTATP